MDKGTYLWQSDSPSLRHSGVVPIGSITFQIRSPWLVRKVHQTTTGTLFWDHQVQLAVVGVTVVQE